MGALLHLVNPGPASFPAVMHPTEHEPRVFTDSFRQRLATLNNAERELRSMGLHVVWSRLAGPKPQAHIHRDDKTSVAQLMDRMGPRSFSKQDGCTVISGEFEGVIVSWVQS